MAETTQTFQHPTITTTTTTTTSSSRPSNRTRTTMAIDHQPPQKSWTPAPANINTTASSSRSRSNSHPLPSQIQAEKKNAASSPSPPRQHQTSPSASPSSLHPTSSHNVSRFDPNRRLSAEGPHGLGETVGQHREHAHIAPKIHWGLGVRRETQLFYALALPSLALEIAASVCGTYYHTWGRPFIGCMSAFMFLHWAAWLQTAIGMIQRASWVRDESDLVERRQYLYLAVRLNRLMIPTAIVAFVTFIQAYARRYHLHDLAYWLLFLLVFIWNTVFSVMNAYNNITWESDRLLYEEGEQPYRLTRLAILGIPSNVRELPPNPKGD